MENLDLSHYLQQARKSGMVDEQIRQGLLQAGWPEVDVDEAIRGLPRNSANTPSPKAMMSKSLAIIFTVATVAIVGYSVGAYYMSSYQGFSLWPFEAEVSVATFTPRPSPVATPDPTADWQTYRNEEYGIEFKYPTDWSVSVDYDLLQIIRSNSHYISVEPESRSDIVKRFRLDSYYMQISGKESYLDERTNIVNGSNVNIIVTNAFDKDIDALISYTATPEEKSLSILNQILSTFKFFEATGITDCGETGLGNLDPAGVNKNCMNLKFKECSPAKLIATRDLGQPEGVITYYYEVVGLNDNYCFVKSKLLEHPNPDWVNKEMVCSLDNKEDFETAVKNLGYCTGELYDLRIGK